MKVKTSITLSEYLLELVDEIAGDEYSRSAVIEESIKEYIKTRKKQAQREKDLEILNSKANTLNREAKGVLNFQVEI